MRCTNGRIQVAQYSVGMNCSFGKRVARPWPMIDAIASCTTFLSDIIAWNAGEPCALNGSISPGKPSHSFT